MSRDDHLIKDCEDMAKLLEKGKKIAVSVYEVAVSFFEESQCVVCQNESFQSSAEPTTQYFCSPECFRKYLIQERNLSKGRLCVFVVHIMGLLIFDIPFSFVKLL